MSLPVLDTQGSLFGSVYVLAKDLFAQGDRYRLFAEKIYPLLLEARAEIEKAYCADNGRPGVEPVVLMGVLLFQFLERVPDRQAVDLVKYHLGWKLALNLEVASGAFHATCLVHFRQRLIDNEQASLLFKAILEALVDNDLLPRRCRQRLDSTHVVGLVARISRLECVRETLRLALEELSEKLAQEERPDFWPLYWERYVESVLDYKSSEESLKSKQRAAGEDIQRLFYWLEALPVEVRDGRQVSLLREVFEQQYRVEQSGVAPVKSPAPAVVHNPHEPEAHWSAKGQGKAKKDWVGYKVQVAESIATEALAKGEPTRNFITSIVTQDAIESDEAGLPATLEKQEVLGLEKPSELYTDGAYVSAQALAQAQSQGRELVGPAQPSPTSRREGFRSEDFEIRVEERRAVCPGGKENTQCSRLEEEKSGKVSYRFEWSTAHCQECPLREQCLGSDQRHRTLVVGQYHSVLQQRRREQKSPEFAERMKARNAIEGTQSELVRGHGMRKARYRGKGKVDLQNQLIGAACNIKRWLHRVAWEMKSAAKAEISSSIEAEALG